MKSIIIIALVIIAASFFEIYKVKRITVAYVENTEGIGWGNK